CGAGGLFVQVGRGAGGAFAAPVPFSTPYLELRRLGSTARSLEETRRFSADVYAYFTADPNLRLWGPIAQAWPKSEGLLFPGLTIVVLAAIGVRHRQEEGTALRFFLFLSGTVIVALLLGFSIRLPGIKITSLSRVMLVCAAGGAIVIGISRPSRAAVSRWLMSPAGIFAAITLFAVFMSFGPEIYAKGRMVAASNVYAIFYSL